LPAAIEVVLYPIALKALTNVIRHAQANRCIITLQMSEHHLTLTIGDDGSGLSPDYVAGVGLRSMREPAEDIRRHLYNGCSRRRWRTGHRTIAN